MGKVFVLGITGGVASGKSSIAGFLETFGACRISADEIARELLAPGSEMTKAVIAQFGTDYEATGESSAARVPLQIDRSKLGRRIFADDAARRLLGEIMHPEISKRMQAGIDTLRQYGACPLIAVEIPLLYENGLQSMVDAVVVAVCPEAVQVDRLMCRSSSRSEADALRQVRSQMPTSEKAARADYIVDTDRPLPHVRNDVEVLYGELIQEPPAALRGERKAEP